MNEWMKEWKINSDEWMNERKTQNEWMIKIDEWMKDKVKMNEWMKERKSKNE